MARPTQPSTDAQRAAYERSNRAIKLARERGLSPSRAARSQHTTLETVKRYRPDALRRLPNGRFRVSAFERRPRPSIRFLTADGAIQLDVRDSRTRSAIARHWNAVDRYLATGKGDELRAFRGKSFTVAGVRYRYITDTKLLETLGDADEVRFEDLYAIAA